MSLPVRGWGLFPNLFPSVAGFCGQAHRALSISPTREVSLTSSWWALTYSSHLWPVVGDALTIMRYSFYNDVEALLRRY